MNLKHKQIKYNQIKMKDGRNWFITETRKEMSTSVQRSVWNNTGETITPRFEFIYAFLVGVTFHELHSLRKRK